MSDAPLPIWVTLILPESRTLDEIAARAKELGVAAEVTSSRRLQLPHGFLAWLGDAPFPEHLLDTSAAEEEVSGGPLSVHLSGGTNELEERSHQEPDLVRKMRREMREAGAVISGKEPRILSAAGEKVERLTELLRKLLPLAVTVVFPRANHVAFSAHEFARLSADYDFSSYHFPLYVFTKLRQIGTGSYAVSTGLFLFALPEIAMPMVPGKSAMDMARAIGNLENEMVAEGWWPESGATFDTELGSVRLERVVDGLFAVPSDVEKDEAHVRAARHRFALERCARGAFGDGTVHRTSREGGFVADHHLMPEGESFAITNGLSLTPQRGGSREGGNELVELVLFTKELGPWANGWLEWIAAAIRDNDGAQPMKPMDRVALQEPQAGIAGVVLWPMGYFEPFGKPVHLLGLVPILEEELALFRREPTAQRAWAEERRRLRDLEMIHARWGRVIPK